MRIITVILLLTSIILSCTNDKKEKVVLIEMNKAFKVYIRDNDLRKDFVTKLERVDALSYEVIEETDRESKSEMYKAQIIMKGTASLMYSSKIYNINDTVTCYFDENLKMLRLVNPNSTN